MKSALVGSIGAGLSAQVHGFNILPAYPVKDKYSIAIMGLNGRGSAHAEGFALQAKSEVAYICDVDERDRKSTRLNSSHGGISRMPSSA